MGHAVNKTEQWRAELTPEEYQVLCELATGQTDGSGRSGSRRVHRAAGRRGSLIGTGELASDL
jgi:hypothetical protein